MRRPAPLPTQPEQETAPRAKTRARRAAEPRESLDEASLAAEPADEPVGGTPSDDPGPLTNRDLWRAARARRKALRAEIRRFTQRSRRRRNLWLGGIGAVVLLIGGSIAAAYSPLFAVEHITVVGASSLDPGTVEAALSSQVGTPLALVDDSEVKAALLAFPLIETYALEAKPPHDLTVRIVERTPIGVLRSDAGYTLVDAAGVALATTSDQPAGQPLLDVKGGSDSAAFRSVGLVVRSVPADVRSTLTGVSASTEDDVTLTLSSGLVVMWGNAEDSPEKALALSTLLRTHPDAHSIDVSAPTLPTVG